MAGQLLAEHGLSPGLARARTGEARPAGQSPAGQGPAGQGPAGQAPIGQGPAGQDEPAIAPADALAAIGIDVAAIRQQADAAFGPGEFVYPRLAYDAAARAAIEQAVAAAQTLGHDYVGTGHMLLGLLAAGDNAGGRILGSVGLGAPAGQPLVLARTGEQRE